MSIIVNSFHASNLQKDFEHVYVVRYYDNRTEILFYSLINNKFMFFSFEFR